MILRVISDFCFSSILVMIFGNIFLSSINDEIKLQKTYSTIQRFIFVITLILCFLEAVRIEMLTPSRVAMGTNIVVAGAVAQYGNFILRKHSSILKRTIITGCLFLVMGAFTYSFFRKSFASLI
jgi:hypothetical protein